jgi:ribose/xylose/arabinose/galactoside ABC-type transport system permease subunit
MIRRWLFSEYIVLLLSAACFAGMLPFTPGLGSPANLANIVSAMLPLLIVAIGQTIVLISRGIDLSITGTIALASVAGALMMSGENGWLGGHVLATPAGVGVMLAIGAIVGGVNGFSITKLNMPPFMVTLTTMMFAGGLAVWVTQSKNIFGLPARFNAIGGQLIPALAVTLLVACIAHLALGRTVYGRWLYALGQNPNVARVAGIPVQRMILTAYIVSGLCAGLAAILYTGRLETGSPAIGQRILLDVIGASVIGGSSLFGGKGKVLWTVFGTFFLVLIDNALNLQNLSHFSIMMVKGAVILLAATLDALRHTIGLQQAHA